MQIFNSLKPEGGNKLHPFDLSRRDVFSVKSGVLNVNFVQHTIPESKYEVNHAQITRVDPIQTASFARMSENYEYYFVPYSQIFHDFERLYYERGEEQRNYGNAEFGSQSQVSLSVPCFKYADVVDALLRWFIGSRFYLKCEEQYPRSAASRLATYYDSQDLSNLGVTRLFPFDIHGDICVDEMIKLFDMLGYGNLFPSFNSMISPLLQFTPPAVLTNLDGETDFTKIVNALNESFCVQLCQLFPQSDYRHDTTTAVYTFTFSSPDYPDFIQAVFNCFRLSIDSDGEIKPYWLSAMGFAEIEYLTDLIFNNDDSEFDYVADFRSDIASANRYPSIMAIAAYQKVFTDIYRNTQFDTSFYATLFNFDYIVDTQQSVVAINRVLCALMPRFRQYKKDMFTGVFPNAQFGSVAVSGLENPTTIMGIGSSGSSNNVVVNTNNSLLQYGNPVKNTWQINSGISALSIRQALSLQKYKERILRAGNRVTALQTAIFGDRSRFIEDEYVQFIGAEHNMIDFNSVAATSDAGSSEVGQLGQNGVGTHVGKAFEFHSHDFGIIIGIYYILPESEYEAFMIDPMNTKSETNDFYKPDFMNLGLSPVFNYNFNFLGYEHDDGDSVLGYLANYWEYKTAIDKVHGTFYASLPSKGRIGYHGPSFRIPTVNNVETFTRGSNAFYVTPRNAQSFRTALTLGNLYVSPHDVDSIFYVNSDFTMVTDQFKVNCNHDVKALLPMSVVGLPDY